MIGRRGFITGLVSLVAAPAIVRAGSLMPVKVMPPALTNLEIINLALQRLSAQRFAWHREWEAVAMYVAGDEIKYRGIDYKAMYR